MGYELTGSVWDAESFETYISDVSLGWAKSVTVHHTATPNLRQRPQGWTIQHMRNIRHFYEKVKRWSAGPHLFTDEDQIFGMSSLYRRGVHAVSFNRDSIGIEALGDYDSESPDSGRGLKVWKTTAEAVALLLKRMNLPVNEETVKFHRDDPRTSKTCPGTKVKKAWFISMVNGYYAGKPVHLKPSKPFPSMPDVPRLLTDRQKLDAIAAIINQ